MKKLIFGLTAIVIVITGIFTLAGCEKEETSIGYNITNCAQNYGYDGNSPKPEKFYQLTICLTTDNKNGTRCENVPWKPTAFRCSSPHKCRALESLDDQYPNGNDANITHYFQSRLDEVAVEYGEFKYCKPFIEQNRDLLDYLHEIHELIQTSDELYQNAPEQIDNENHAIEESVVYDVIQ